MRPTRRALTTGLTAAAALAAWPGAGAAAVRPDDKVLGTPTAPVTVYQYASPTCPHCARWHAQVWPAFKAKYVNTGKVRFVFREFVTAPGNESAAGLMVARCAGPNYFRVMDALFAGQATMVGGDALAWLNQAGAAGGLTPAQVQACYSDQAGLAALRVRLTAADAHGVNSTPTFIINDTVKLAGEQSLAALDEAIQPLLRGIR